MDYFYDGQIERYLLQFIRIFSDIKIQNEPDQNGISVQKRVPVKYGDMSRMVANIISNNSQNTMLSAPAMAVTISSLKKNDKRRQDPTFVGKIQGTELEYDANTQQYTANTGNRYSIDRYMPVAYDMTLELDIWTTNTNNKLQLLEQILAIFNPAVQLQQNDNPFDWSSIFEVTLNDIKWSNRNIPVGADSKDDICTLTFEIPIWVNSPAKVKRQRIIEQIQINIYDAHGLTDSEIQEELFTFGNEIGSITITPGNYKLSVTPNGQTNIITLLDKHGVEKDDLTWESIINEYGKIINGITRIRLKTDDNIESTDGDVIGTVTQHNDGNKLIFTVDGDSLPSTIPLSPVTNFIDAATMAPGYGLPPAAYGQKYVVINNFVGGEEPAIKNKTAWGNLVANNNDIVQYNGTQWVVIFNSEEEVGDQHIINTNDMQHYKFNGTEWVYTYIGEFNPGFWKLENLDRQ